MTKVVFYSLVAVGLFTIGFYTLLLEVHLLRKIMALNIVFTSVFLLLIAIAARYPQAIDPLPHAFVLIGILISFSATALALTLARRIYQETDQTDLSEKQETGIS
jgi:multicomponent Na+:H+ antiporter subunit C